MDVTINITLIFLFVLLLVVIYPFIEWGSLKSPLKKISFMVKKPVSSSAVQASTVKQWFFKGNPLTKLGIAILLVGGVFLVKYVAEHEYLSIEIRLLLAASGGLVLLIMGWLARHKRLACASLLQGSGLGVMYMTVYAAYQLYQLLPSFAVFAVLFLFSFAGGAIAVLQNTRGLAICAVIGGFLAPLLSASNSGNDIGLLSYYLLLNVLISMIATYRAWRWVNRLSFLFTIVLLSIWGYSEYTQDKHLTTQITSGVAISVFIFALYYAVTAYFLLLRGAKKHRLLADVYLVFVILFATLVIPFAVDSRWVSAAWALESFALIWLSVRQNYWWGWTFGVLLQFLAGYFLLSDFSALSGTVPFLNTSFIGGLVIAITSVASAYFLSCRLEETTFFKHRFAQLIFIWGMSWWVFIISKQLYLLFPHFVAIPYLLEHSSIRLVEVHPQVYNESFYWSAVLVFALVTALGAWYTFLKLNWQYAYNVAILLMPTMVAIFFANMPQYATLFVQLPVWLAALMVLYWLLYQYEKYPMSFLKLYHGPTFVLLVWQVTLWMSLSIAIGVFRLPSLKHLLYAIVPAMFLFLLQSSTIIQQWPCKKWPQQYLGTGGFLIVLYLMFWLLFTNLQLSKNITLHPYLPILNLVDVTSLIALVSALLWIMREENFNALNWDKNFRSGLLIFLGGVLFVWLNAVLLRSLMIYFDLKVRTIFSVHIVQMAVSILWGVTAFVMIVIANRLSLRRLWMVAAALIALVLLKMLLVDFAGSDVVERMLSFIVVGMILLVIGFILPLPPAYKE